VARTKDNFKFAHGPAWALLDVDAKDPGVVARVQRLGGVWPILAATYPPLQQAARVRRNSQSACVRVAYEPPFVTLSQHIYVLLGSGLDTPAFVERLHQRLWLVGFGFISIGAAGQLLERSLIDCAVASPERLIFEGPPCLNDRDLYIDLGLRRTSVRDGIAIKPPPPLSDEDERRYFDAVQAAQRSLQATAEQVGYERWRARGADDATARRLAQGVARDMVLLPLHQHLGFKRLPTVTVREALLDPDRYVNQDLLDPVEPIRGDYCARFLRGKRDYTCFIKSFAHGGRVYQLQYDFAAAEVALKTCPKNLRGDTYWSIVNKFNLPEDGAA
jgi:hypothetical protein